VKRWVPLLAVALILAAFAYEAYVLTAAAWNGKLAGT
jgi:hypothetical protein